jgi:uncharacterized membrane protein YjjP (DUF1212 family)/uncharacterized membrane protein YjjB (DUF3815 family)
LAPGESEAAGLTEALDCLLRFGSVAMRTGTPAFRVREWIGTLARAMKIEALAVHIALGALTVTGRQGGRPVTIAGEIAPIGIDAWRMGAIMKLSARAEPGISPHEVNARIDAIEASPGIHGVLVTALAVGLASGAFSYLNGGGPLEVIASLVGGGIGQSVRSLLFRRHLNQYAVTALCAVIASSIYVLVTSLLGEAGFPSPRHAAGFISSTLFLMPGFPLVAALLDLLQNQIVASIARLAYGLAVLMAAAFGLSLVAAAAGLTAAYPPPPEIGEPLTLLLRAIASFVAGCGFAILYNSSCTVLTIGCLALIGNELRLGVHDLGLNLPPATVLGATAVGLLASWIRPFMHEPRVALTVPGIIVMIPGTYAFQTIVLFNQGYVLEALHAAVLGSFVVGAMAVGLVAARFITERHWMVES